MLVVLIPDDWNLHQSSSTAMVDRSDVRLAFRPHFARISPGGGELCEGMLRVPQQRIHRVVGEREGELCEGMLRVPQQRIHRVVGEREGEPYKVRP